MNRQAWAWRKYYMGQTMNANSIGRPIDDSTEPYKALFCAVIKRTFLDIIEERRWITAERARAKRNANQWPWLSEKISKECEIRISYRKSVVARLESDLRELCEEVGLNSSMIIERAKKYAGTRFNFEKYKKLVEEDYVAVNRKEAAI